MRKIKNKVVSCMGCSAQVPDIKGPTHKYLGASPGCWSIFSGVLAKEYSDQEYMKVHNLTVDAYAAQHIGKESPQTTQSVNLHLLSLCVTLEHGIEYSFIPKVMNKKVKEYKEVFTWLLPPKSLGDLTIIDVVKAKNANEHEKLVRGWAISVWNAWEKYHTKVEDYLHSLV